MTEYTKKGLLAVALSFFLLVFVTPFGAHLIANHCNCGTNEISTYLDKVATMFGFVCMVGGVIGGGIVGFIGGYYLINQEDL